MNLLAAVQPDYDEEPTVLIVDDDVIHCRVLADHLRSDGFATVAAGSGEQALALIASQPPDLVLLGAVLPTMEAYHVANALKCGEKTADIPILVMTTAGGQSYGLARLHEAAEEFITQPVDPSKLCLRIRTMLRLKRLEEFLRKHVAILEERVGNRTADLQRFRNAMDATIDGILVIDRKTMRYVEANHTACAMLGFDREQLLSADPASIGAVGLGAVAELYDEIIADRRVASPLSCRYRCNSGAELDVEVRRHAFQWGGDWTIVEVVRPVAGRSQPERRALALSQYDPLTGLPNRNLFYKTLTRTLVAAAEQGHQVVVMLVDLDHFKRANDTLGYSEGDELLQQVGGRLTQCVRGRDTVSRLDGDEFALILVMPNGHVGGGRVAEKLRDALRAPFEIDGRQLTLTSSIGMTVFPEDGADAESLLKHADTALLRSKLAGRDNFLFFTAQMNADMTARMELEAALRRAVDNQEFVLHYQPKIHLKTGRVVGVEALLRWRRPGAGLVPPNQFIPMLEECGLITRVGSWVIAQAARQAASWQANGLGAVPIAVNVASRQFVDGTVEADVHRALEDNNIRPELLELELTESSLMENTERTVAALQRLKAMGVAIAIDDFGTGYSSLAYLRNFPLDKLKIDIAFIRHITDHADDAAIALAIIRLAKSLRLQVIAEGVESEAQLSFLRRHGCCEAQGYYFSRPLAAQDLELLLDGATGAWAAQAAMAGSGRADASAKRRPSVGA